MLTKTHLSLFNRLARHDSQNPFLLVTRTAGRLEASEFQQAIVSCASFKPDIQWDKAITDCDSAIAQDRHDYRAYCCRGQCRFEKEEWPQALADFKRVLRIRPAESRAAYQRYAATALFYIGQILLLQRHHQQAIDYLSKAITSDPKNVSAYFCRGLAFAALHDSERARADYVKAESLNPDVFKRLTEQWKATSAASQNENGHAKLHLMVSRFLGCVSVEQAFDIARRTAQVICPRTSGAIYCFAEQAHLLTKRSAWGELAQKAEFEPQQCVGWIRMHPHCVEPSGTDSPCDHWDGPPCDGHVCLPLAARGVFLGVAHIQGPANALPVELAILWARDLAMAISNLRAAEAWRERAETDELTGLNRMNESRVIQRFELEQARRPGEPVGVVMLDLDFFKQVNTEFDELGGNAYLKEVGKFLRMNVRKEDIPCRFGGEEFTVILPGATLQATIERAEQLRQRIKEVRVPYKGRPIGPLTMSIGAAAFPENGVAAGDILDAAVRGMRAAKEQGRDRVVAASPG